MAEEYLTDDEQLEHVKRVVAENWLWVLGGIVLGVAIIVGYRHYTNGANELALRAAARFDDMTAALERNDTDGSRRVAAALIEAYPKSPYADQARLALARLDVDAGDFAKAVAPLTAVMNDSKDSQLKLIARLRLARVQSAAGKPDEALATLTAGSWGAFAGTAHEVRGDVLYAKQDHKGALGEYQAALEAAGAGPAAGLLELKIADLGAAPAAPAAPAVAEVTH